MISNALLLVMLAATPARPAPHPFTAEDLNALDRISDPRVSPDGKWVVFEVRTTDLEANKGRFDLWIAAADGSGARPLTTHPDNDNQPRWARDGRSVYFLSTRGGSSQVWQISLDGGEARQLTRLPIDVDAFAIFPDGERLLLALDVYPGTTPEETAKRAAAEEPKPSVRVIDQLLYRHWDTWEDGKRDHLFTYKPGDAAPVDLMAGMNADCPTKPFGGTEDFAISPDGKEIAFAAKLAQRDEAWTTNVDVWTVAADGKGKPKNLTADNKAFDGTPAYSPDGKTLSYTAMQRPGFESDRQRFMLVDRASGKRRVLAEAWDHSPGEYSWSKDGKTLYVAADNLGHHALFSIDAQSGEAKLLVEKGNNANINETEDGLVYAHDDLRLPVELFSVPKAGGTPKQLTQLNAAKLATMVMGEPEQFSFDGAKGDKVYGFLVKPAGFKAGKKYPVALIVHGGPQGSMGDHFHYRWNPQPFAGAGYAVLFIDFHGSTGYGQAFTDSISKDWGGAPFEDLMKGLDFAFAKYPFLDGKRACALGASYGGYMMNWLEGHTDRFKCLVNHDGLFDTVSAYYETEELWFPEWEMGGPPWEQKEAYEKFSPRAFVANWKTPMLVVHGGMDFRVTETQGMSTFTALQRRGVPSRFVHFPAENHWVLKPKNSIRWHAEVLKWLGEWTR